tara:strand:- start:246 stop:629 length:384 start_codon:yes stop_codon:yes gene_type:complete
MNVFDYVNAINRHRDIIRQAPQPDLAEKSYDPFIINRAFSYYNDTLMQSNELNQRPWIDKKLQNDLLLNSIRPRKRWTPWAKPEKIEAVELVKEYYKYNYERAREAVSILSKEDIEIIRETLYRGGE